MSLDKILQALESAAAAEIAEIEWTAEVERARVRTEAEAQALAVQQKHKEMIVAPLQAERARILNRAKLEALRTVLGAREELIGAALKAAATRLAVLRNGDAYARALDRLAREAVAALDQNSGLHLCVESRDRPLLACIVGQWGLQVTVEEGTTSDGAAWDCPGGVVAMSADRRISVVNTLSARLQRVATLYRSEIAAMLFSEAPQARRVVLPPGD
jgi:vacuolar-type H+-ATPase subunit E/Vma4